MKRTVSLKLDLTIEGQANLLQTQKAFSKVCNQIVPFVRENRCWNQVALHHLCYYSMREQSPEMGSQMVCNAIRKVCSSYKVQKVKKDQEMPSIKYREDISVRYCARTFSFKDQELSFFSIAGRIRCSFTTGDFQKKYLAQGVCKEGELVRKGKRWFFNLVLDIPDPEPSSEGGTFAIDLGENNLAVTSQGSIYGGGKLRHERDKFLNRRAKLQSNGSRAAKRCLKEISGREKRRVKETNHTIAKKIVKEAIDAEAKTIVLENLTNIRRRIRGSKKMKSRLHRWSFAELQNMIEYKAQGLGMNVVYINPAYTSLTCSHCGSIGVRKRHCFKCARCGSYQHSDRNAAVNLWKLGKSVVLPTASVNMPMVAVTRLATSFRL